MNRIFSKLIYRLKYKKTYNSGESFIIFIVSGFWHGANWTFIIWGALNAIYFIPLLLAKKNRSNLGVIAQNSHIPALKEVFKMLLNFTLVLFAWIFFRARDLEHALLYIGKIFSPSTFSIPVFEREGGALMTLLLIIGFMITEWFGRHGEYGISKLGSKQHRMVRWSIYSVILFMIGIFMKTSETEFIYFRF